MKKRIFALILSTVLSFSIMFTGMFSPLTIHAADGDVNPDKTTEWVDEENGVARITLTISNEIEPMVTAVMTRIVLVIDTSGSMQGSRLSSVKTAAKNFVTNILALSSASNNVQIAVVEYADDARVRQQFSNSATTINSRIDAFVAGGGTFIQDGIKAAQGLLDAVTAENEIIVVLSDGEPTYSYRVTGVTGITHADCTGGFAGININHGNWTINNPQITAYSSQRVGNGSDYSIPSASRYGVDCNRWPYSFHSSGFPADNGVPTIYEAGLAKAKGTEIYTIAYATSSTAAAVMGGVATDAGHAVASANADEAFGLITDSIIKTILATGGLVTDIMGHSSTSGQAYTFNLITNDATNYPITLTGPDGVPVTVDVTNPLAAVYYDSATLTLLWNLASSDGSFLKGDYTLVYYVKLDDSNITASGPITIKTNDSATITFVDLDGVEQTLSFPSPTLTYNKAAQYTITYKDSFTSSQGGFADQTYPASDGAATPAFDGGSGSTVPTHTGYRFNGWSPTWQQTVSGDQTYIAQWVEQHTVTYTDGSGSETHFADYVVPVDTGSSVPSYLGGTTPIHSDPTSFVFDGWSPDPSATSSVTANLVFTATWRTGSINSHDVTYKSTQSGCTFETTRSFEENSAIPDYWGTPNPPVCSGYQFGGWNEPKGLTSLTEEAILTAIWNELFTVTYKDGASGSVFTDQVYNNVVAGSTVPVFLWNGIAGNPVRDGYRFDGWDSSTSGTVTANTVFTAQWTKYVKVTYTDGVAEDLFTDVVYNDLVGGDTTPMYNNALSLNVPTLDARFASNYTFIEWSPLWDSTVGGSDITYTAVWEYNATVYDVEYRDGAGETVFPNVVMSIEEGDPTPFYDALDLDNKPTRAGYTFVRWEPTWSDTVTGDVVYVAVWRKGSPKTGVNNDTAYYVAIAGGAIVIGGLAYFVLNKKGKKEE